MQIRGRCVKYCVDGSFLVKKRDLLAIDFKTVIVTLTDLDGIETRRPEVVIWGPNKSSSVDISTFVFIRFTKVDP